MNNLDADVPIKDAATVLLLRRDRGSIRVLMGQRGKRAVFMPNKFVFPGGGVEEDDYAVSQEADIPESLLNFLRENAEDDLPHALVNAAVRELSEETGLNFKDAAFHRPPPLHFFFRAITPPGRPRRFDARFFGRMLIA